MRLTDFTSLNRAQQVKLLYETAVYIGKHREKDTVSVLYQLDGFYVEIFYTKYRWYIRRINVFESVDCLEPYLSVVDVEELINS